MIFVCEDELIKDIYLFRSNEWKMYFIKYWKVYMIRVISCIFYMICVGWGSLWRRERCV